MKCLTPVLVISLLLTLSIAAEAQTPNLNPDDVRGQVFTQSFSTSKGRLGILAQSMTPELREYFGAPGDRGVLVAKVQDDTPASRAGVEVGDVVTAVGGEPVASTAELIEALNQVEKDEAVPITLVRNKVGIVLTVTLDTEPIPGFGFGDAGSPFGVSPFDGPLGPPFDMDSFGSTEGFARKMLEEQRRRMKELWEHRVPRNGADDNDEDHGIQLWPPVEENEKTET